MLWQEAFVVKLSDRMSRMCLLICLPSLVLAGLFAEITAMMFRFSRHSYYSTVNLVLYFMEVELFQTAA